MKERLKYCPREKEYHLNRTGELLQVQSEKQDCKNDNVLIPLQINNLVTPHSHITVRKI
jgi:hypothetical protein